MKVQDKFREGSEPYENQTPDLCRSYHCCSISHSPLVASSIVGDTERTSFFASKGYKVLRFWNNDVMKDIE